MPTADELPELPRYGDVIDGRYRLGEAWPEASDSTGPWWAHDIVLDRRVVLARAATRDIDCEHADVVQPITVLEGSGGALAVFDAPPTTLAQHAMMQSPEAIVGTIARVVVSMYQQDRADVRSLLHASTWRVAEVDRVVALHPLLVRSTAPDAGDVELLVTMFDDLCGARSDSLTSRRVGRAFPQLAQMRVAWHRMGRDSALADVIDDLEQLGAGGAPLVEVVGGGPIMFAPLHDVAESPAASAPLQPRAPDVGSDSVIDDVIPGAEIVAFPGSTFAAVETAPRKRFRAPSRTVLVVTGIVLLLGLLVWMSLRAADKVSSHAPGNVPAAKTRAILSDLTNEQRELNAAMSTYRGTAAQLARVRDQGAELERASRAAVRRLRTVDVRSAQDAELRQHAISLVQAQLLLGDDASKLSKRPTALRSVDGQVLVIDAQEVAKQYAGVTVTMSALRVRRLDQATYTDAPTAAKHVLDVVTSAEFDRQQAQMDAQIRRQQAALRQRIKASESAFRDKMMAEAYASWRLQFDALEARANRAISRGHAIAQSTANSGGCEAEPFKRNVGERGAIMFLLNTLVPPNRTAANRQIALQRRLGESIQTDFELVATNTTLMNGICI